MPVDFDCSPAESLELFFDGCDFHDLLCCSVDLEFVVIDDGGEIAELEVGSGHGGFPDLSFLQFAVTEEGENMLLRIREGESDREAESLSETAASDFDAGSMRSGVSLEISVDLSKFGKLFFGEISALAEDGVESGGGVTFAEDEKVTFRVEWFFGIVLEDAAEVEGGEDVHGAEAAAGVTGVGCGDHFEGGDAELVGEDLEIFFGHCEADFSTT